MANKTKIQWCDSTVNPSMGCDGCELWAGDVKVCYAGTMTQRFGGVTEGYPKTFEEVKKYPGRMKNMASTPNLVGTARADKPWLNNLPRLVFVSDMGDSLSSDIDFEYLKTEVIDTVQTRDGLRHRWQWLTKRPQRMHVFGDWLLDRGISWPRNLWVGTSITNKASLSRIEQLLKVGDENTIRFLSIEPQWEAVDISPWIERLSWIIQGGQSGTDPVAFHVEWAEEVLALCRKHNKPYFLKQLGGVVMRNGSRVMLEDNHGGDWDEWDLTGTTQLRVRQFPI